jgi:hypothetical protein
MAVKRFMMHGEGARESVLLCTLESQTDSEYGRQAKPFFLSIHLIN